MDQDHQFIFDIKKCGKDTLRYLLLYKNLDLVTKVLIETCLSVSGSPRSCPEGSHVVYLVLHVKPAFFEKRDNVDDSSLLPEVWIVS